MRVRALDSGGFGDALHDLVDVGVALATIRREDPRVRAGKILKGLDKAV